MDDGCWCDGTRARTRVHMYIVEVGGMPALLEPLNVIAQKEEKLDDGDAVNY